MEMIIEAAELVQTAFCIKLCNINLPPQSADGTRICKINNKDKSNASPKTAGQPIKWQKYGMQQ